MKQYIHSLRNNKKLLIIGGILVGFLLLIGVFYVVISAVMGGSDEESGTASQKVSKNDDSSVSGEGQGGTNLQGDVRKLIGSVTSTRNLKGLTLRINQIDTCELPKATAYIAVTNVDGVVTNQLRKGDITVSVDGKKVSDFSLDSVSKNKRPISSTLVLDHSGSMRGAPMDQAKAAAGSFVTSSGMQDSFAVIQFDHTVDVLQQRTVDKTAASNVISAIQVRGDTAVYDAVSTAIDNTSGCGRKAIVLLSDGEDTASKSSNLQSAINKANMANLPIFTVGLKSAGYTPTILQQIADQTGGQYYEANTPADLTSLYQKIDAQLKGQYFIGLKFNVEKTGQQHSLKITSTVEGSPTTSERFFMY